MSPISETSQYLTFKLDEEIFALDVSQVREVLDLSPITKVPRSPDFMRGVINVRGSVVPVADLRMKFGIPKTEPTVDTRIVVMEITIDEETTVLGALADAVEEVIELDPDKIEKPPRIGTRWRTEFIKGIGKQDDHFIIILDIDRVFSTDELLLADAAGSEASGESSRSKSASEAETDEQQAEEADSA
jgi:purine-binding chemotaxis protein CheW